MKLSSLRFNSSGSIIIRGRNASTLRHLDSQLWYLSSQYFSPDSSTSSNPRNSFLSCYFILPSGIQFAVSLIFNHIVSDASLFLCSAPIDQHSFHDRCLKISEYSLIAARFNPTDFITFFLYTYYAYVFRFKSDDFEFDELPF